MTRTYAILIAIALSLIGFGVYTVYLLHEGGASATAAQAQSQVKLDKKVKKQNDKIDKATPYGGTAADVAGFLLAHTRDR